MRRSVLAHVAALAGAFLAIVVVTALWIVNLRLGPTMEGFTGGPLLVSLPLALLVLTALWAVLRAVFGRRRFGPAAAFLGGAILAAIVVVGYCGPTACFVPGPDRLLGWFVVAGTGLAALVHHLVLDRFNRETGDVQTT